MPGFQLVPMLFSSWKVSHRNRRGPPPTDSIDDDGSGPDLDPDGFAALLEKYRGANVENLSSTEEDDADESLEDWWQQQQKQQVQLTPTTTTTATAAATETAAPTFFAPGGGVRERSELDESIGSGASPDQMKVIPFVSLHLDPAAASPSSSPLRASASSSASSSTSPEDRSFFWRTTLAKALVDDDREEEDETGSRRLESKDNRPSHPPVVRASTGATSSATDRSPSTCSSTRLRTVPLRSILPARSKGGGAGAGAGATKAIRSRHHRTRGRHLWPTIPSTISVLAGEARDAAGRSDDGDAGERDDETGAMIWDPARPLAFGDPARDPAEWAGHAMDLRSPFAERCREIRSLMAADRPDGRILALVARWPELCLVRFRVDCHNRHHNSSHHATQYLLHWCCRQVWLEGAKHCCRAIPEVVGYSLDNELPLHVAVVAAAGGTQEGSLELVKFLCQRYPLALKQTNARLQTGLHLALSASRVDEALVDCLLTWYPTAALLADEDGWTPTHYVCRMRDESATRVLRLLLQRAPSAIDAVTRNLEKPIHVAAQNNAGDLIKVFLESEDARCHASEVDRPTSFETTSSALNDSATAASDEPFALRRPACFSPAIQSSLASCLDSKSNTPVHYLAMHGDLVDLQAMRALVVSCPMAKTMMNGDGVTPLELAVQGHAQSVLNLLAR